MRPTPRRVRHTATALAVTCLLAIAATATSASAESARGLARPAAAAAQEAVDHDMDHPPMSGTASVDDSGAWTTSGTFRTKDGWWASPIHVAALDDGRLWFVGIARNADPPETATESRRVSWLFTPPAPGQPVPAETTITEITEPVAISMTAWGTRILDDDFYCMGATFDRTGRVVTAGGTRAAVSIAGEGTLAFGLPYLSTFDAGTWRRGPTMAAPGALGTSGRWYPTATRLANGSILVTGGFELIDLRNPNQPGGLPNLTVETYDPQTGAQRVLSDAEHTPPAIHAGDYTHVFVLPFDQPQDLLMIGERQVPVIGSASTANSLAVAAPRRPGPEDDRPGYGTSSVMLPIRVENGDHGYTNGAVLVASGNMHTDYEHTANVFDPVLRTWSGSLELGTARHHPSTLALPDGRILIVNGHDMSGGTGPQHAQYVDPRHDFMVTTGTADSGLTRGYHSVAALLPDGRVFVAGGRGMDRATTLEKPSYQIYTPVYPDGPAPQVVQAPATWDYGSLKSVTTTGPPPAEFVLLSPASMTHSFDMNGRSVQIPLGRTFSTPDGTAHLSTVGAPANSHVAPPGTYWLFAVSAAGVPSAGVPVRIGS